MKKSKNKNIPVITKEDFIKGKIIYDNVLIEPLRFDEDGMLKDPVQYEDKPEYGIVKMVGEGRLYDNGIVVPLKVKVGDTVYFQKYSANKIRLSGTDMILAKEEDIYWFK